MATIKTTFKSFSTQHGYYVPSQNKNNIVEITHNTTLFIGVITRGYNLTCKVNGKVQESIIGTPEYTDWKLCLHAGDVVDVEVLKGEKLIETITYAVNEDGVTSSQAKKVNHAIAGTHKASLDIQDKHRKAAAAQSGKEQVLTFGKHAGKSLSSLDSSYLKWLVAHESRLADGNRWACTVAKAILETRQFQQETMAA